jgi:hypothetical protein
MPWSAVPYHRTFSRDSQWATPNAPYWTDDDKLVTDNGSLMYDERAQSLPTWLR